MSNCWLLSLGGPCAPARTSSSSGCLSRKVQFSSMTKTNDLIPRGQPTKEKSRYIDFLKMRHQRASSVKWKDDLQNGREYLQVIYLIFVSRSYRNSYTLIIKRQIGQFKKWAKDLNRYFSKEYVQMANKLKKRCSPSLALRDRQVKTTLSTHFSPTKVGTIKKTDDNRCWEDVKSGLSCITGGHGQWYSYYEKQSGSFSKDQTQVYHMT